MCEADLWALGSSLSSEDAGLDVLVEPEVCLAPPTRSPSNGVCFTASPPRVADVCVCTSVKWSQVPEEVYSTLAV